MRKLRTILVSGESRSAPVETWRATEPRPERVEALLERHARQLDELAVDDVDALSTEWTSGGVVATPMVTHRRAGWSRETLLAIHREALAAGLLEHPLDP